MPTRQKAQNDRRTGRSADAGEAGRSSPTTADSRSPICRRCAATCGPSGGEIHIAKNTLTRIAAEQAGVDGLDPLLEGPSALVFAFEDAVQTAKAVTDFVRTSRILSVKGGVMATAP